MRWLFTLVYRWYRYKLIMKIKRMWSIRSFGPTAVLIKQNSDTNFGRKQATESHCLFAHLKHLTSKVAKLLRNFGGVKRTCYTSPPKFLSHFIWNSIVLEIWNNGINHQWPGVFFWPMTWKSIQNWSACRQWKAYIKSCIRFVQTFGAGSSNSNIIHYSRLWLEKLWSLKSTC